MGSHHQQLCPCGIFKAKDGYIAMIVIDRQWPNLCRAMGMPELEHDPRFSTQQNRTKNQKELIKLIEDWMQTLPDDQAALKLFEEHRVPAGPVLTIVEAVEHEHYKARNMIRTVPDPILGEITIPGFPLKFSATPDLPDLQAPLLGEHGPQVLKDYLGWSDDRVSELKESGVLKMDRR
jgi:CoA:oxalate CoA-transferase